MIRILCSRADRHLAVDITRDGVPLSTTRAEIGPVLELSESISALLEEFSGAAAVSVDDQQSLRYLDELKERGRLLARLLQLPEAGVFSFPAGSAVDLYVPEDLEVVPFELAADDEFLALKYSVMRTYPGIHPETVMMPRSILYAFNASGDPALYAGREFKEKTLQKQLQRLSADVRSKHGSAVNRGNLLKHLSAVDGAVITSHGLADRILAADSDIPASSFQLIQLNNLKLLLNNCCYGAAPGEGHLFRAFMKAGTLHYVGFRSRVALDRAAEASESILDSLAGGRDLRTAVHSARVSLFKRMPLEPSWASLIYAGKGALTVRKSAAVSEKARIYRRAALIAGAVFLLSAGVYKLVGPGPVEREIPGEAADDAGQSGVFDSVTPARDYSAPAACQPSECSRALEAAIGRLRAAKHPIYSSAQKEQLINEIVNSRLPEASKVQAIENEIP